jgi:hypothetical protein
MKLLMVLLAAACLIANVDAQLTPAFVVAKSHSGQFTARAIARNSTARPLAAMKIPMAGTWAFALQMPNPRANSGTNNYVELDPALLVISCERLKEALLLELAANDAWSGRIDLLINSALPEGEEPFLVASLRREGWYYELQLPKSVKPDRLLRALVHVMLLEMANRADSTESAEIPLWLIEGMTAHLRAFNLPTFLVQPKATIVANRLKLDGLDVVREHLRKEPALTFQALSWPDVEQARGAAGLYRDSAQLLVYELLHFKHGRVALHNMIMQLPTHENWQFTFLSAFRAQFTKPLDVEKWWALTCVTFVGNNAMQKWTVNETRNELQKLLDVPVDVHLSTNRLAAPAEITLQEVILHWQRTPETAVIERTIAGLQMLRLHCAPEMDGLLVAYQKTIRDYLQERDRPLRTLHGDESSRLTSLKKSVCRQLDKLDAQREQPTLRRQMAQKG